MRIIAHIIRFIVAAIVLMVTSWIVPGFTVGGFGSACCWLWLSPWSVTSSRTYSAKESVHSDAGWSASSSAPS